MSVLRCGCTPARRVRWQTPHNGYWLCENRPSSCSTKLKLNWLREPKARRLTETWPSTNHTDEKDTTEQAHSFEAHCFQEEAQAPPPWSMAYGRTQTVLPGKRQRLCCSTAVARSGLLFNSASASCVDAVTGWARHTRRLCDGLPSTSCSHSCSSCQILRAGTPEEKMQLAISTLAEYLADRYPGVDWTDAELSRHCDLPRETIKKFRLTGIPFYTADEIAVSLGVHPCRIWKEWWACS